MFVGRRSLQRAHMLEAFTAGWQAALGLNITNQRVLDVVESCYELWLEEATGDRVILGIHFRRRRDLPIPAGRRPVWMRVTAEEVLRTMSTARPTPEAAHRALSTRPVEPVKEPEQPVEVAVPRPRDRRAS